MRAPLPPDGIGSAAQGPSAMTDADLHRLGAAEAAARIREGSLTSEALVRACLERIAAREAQVQAWATLDPEHAMAQAVARDAERPAGPLHGVPVAVKDVFDTHDLPTGHGSPIYRGHRPPRDAAVVALLRRAGAVVLGKSVSTEFATFTPGPTRNPHDPGRTPGGSSSGSAAAVADGMAPLALGSQTAGSVIRPASYCGVVGYKPSFGRIPRSGLWPLADGLDTVGFFTRSVADVALAEAVVVGTTPTPPATKGRWRLGLYRSPEWPHAEPSMQAGVEAAAGRLIDAGAAVAEIDPPDGFAELAEAHWTILRYEVARSMAYERDVHGDRLSKGLRTLIDDGSRIDGEQYSAACALGARCRARLGELFDGIDAVVTAAAPGEAPAGLDSTGDPIMNRVWTLLHTPCVTVPVMRGPGGLPMGLQIAAPPGADARALAAADWVHRTLGTA